ncbi:indole-3-glycerol-phosphate synthase [Aureococcus anophagefferens]|nr:indole-3-glycerol-phosphate synthase [Aureococcus anophagefferens]
MRLTTKLRLKWKSLFVTMQILGTTAVASPGRPSSARFVTVANVLNKPSFLGALTCVVDLTPGRVSFYTEYVATTLGPIVAVVAFDLGLRSRRLPPFGGETDNLLAENLSWLLLAIYLIALACVLRDDASRTKRFYLEEVVRAKLAEVEGLNAKHASGQDSDVRSRLAFGATKGNTRFSAALRRTLDDGSRQLSVVADVKRRSPHGGARRRRATPRRSRPGKVCEELANWPVDALSVCADGPAYGGALEDVAAARRAAGLGGQRRRSSSRTFAAGWRRPSAALADPSGAKRLVAQIRDIAVAPADMLAYGG